VKIVCFSEGALEKKGGIGIVSVPKIAQSLANRGHQVALFMGGNPILGSEPYIQQDIDFIFESTKESVALGAVVYSSMGNWQFAPSMIWKTARYVKDADFITLHSLYSFPVFVGYLLARRYDKPYGLYPHGVLSRFQRTVSVRKKAIYNILIADQILNNAAVVFYTAQGEQKGAQPLQIKAPSVIVPHGFDAAHYRVLPKRNRFRKKYLNNHDGPVILFLGRLNAVKGLDILIQAFAKVVAHLPNARLLLVGSADPPKFEGIINQWLIKFSVDKHTIMTGKLVGEDKLSAFADADIFVFPSHAENFGFAVLEAMASRLPVIVSENFDLALEIKRHEAGIVIPGDSDPSPYSKAMLELLNNSKIRKSMGENGFSLAHTYTWEKSGERLEKVILSILYGKPLPNSLIPT
jgi:glycosyltransferase involved in cell wall biosynthesis